MISTFALHPSASKQLIADAVSRLPEVQNALQSGKIFIGHGTTNAFVAQILTGNKIENFAEYAAGVITQKTTCVTDSENRKIPWCIEKGKLLDTDWLAFIDHFEPGDIFIKGANAVDSQGKVGILIGDPQGGTIGKSIGILRSRGVQIICPVGLEKMISSCDLAEKYMGIHRAGPHLGLRLGYMSLANTRVITEIESIRILFGLDAVQVAAGGVGGMEGSVVLATESDDDSLLEELVHYVKKLNQVPKMKINKKSCTNCPTPCSFPEKDL